MIVQLTPARVVLALFFALFLAGTAPSHAASVDPGPVFNLTGIYDGTSCNTTALAGYTIDNVGVVDGCRVLLTGKTFDVNSDGIADFRIDNAGSTNVARFEIIAGSGASGADQVALRGATIVALTDIANAVIMDFKVLSPRSRIPGARNGYQSMTGGVQLIAKSETVVATGAAWGQLCPDNSCSSTATPLTHFRDASLSDASLVDSTVGGTSISQTDGSDPFNSPGGTTMQAFMRGTVALDRLSKGNRIASLGETIQIGNQPATAANPCTQLAQNEEGDQDGVIAEISTGVLGICYVTTNVSTGNLQFNLLPGKEALDLAREECPANTVCRQTKK